MPEPHVPAIKSAISALLADPDLRERLGNAGIATAADYDFDSRTEALELFLRSLGAPTGSRPPAAPRG
jgi:hypothetical protein